MINIIFQTRYGYEIHLFLIILAIISLFLSSNEKSNFNIYFKQLSDKIIQIHFIFLCIDFLSMIHINCCNMGDNIVFGRYLFSNVYFEGWCGYLILYIIIFLLWFITFGKKKTFIEKKITIIAPLLCIPSVFFICCRIITTMHEYSALECDFDITYKIFYNISKALFENGHYIYYATNVLIPVALTIYTALAIAINIPRLEESSRVKNLKFLRGLNKVTLILIIYYSLFIRSALVLFPFLIINIILNKNIKLLYNDFSKTIRNKSRRP